jgi:CHAT domain-containing protein
MVSPEIAAESLPRIPDLEITVRLDGTGALLFEAHAPDPDLGVNSVSYPAVSLDMRPEAFLHYLFKDIENLPLDTNEAREIAEQRLATEGLTIWKLFPSELQDLLWRRRRGAQTLLIQSDEPFIPWEIARLEGQDRKRRVVEGPFLCEAFAVTRWVRGVPHKIRLPIRNLALVVPRNSQLKEAAAEQKDIHALVKSYGRQANDIEPTRSEVWRAMASGDYDGWHFAGHGVATGDDANRWAIELDGPSRLAAEDLLEEPKNLGLARPLVFLNGCTTGRGGLTLTGPGGWSRAFLEANAGAFIGTHWAVADRKSRELANSFYEGLFKGLPIGEAFRQARRSLHEKYKGDPTWLAYTVFAHPLASCGQLSSDAIRRERPVSQASRRSVRREQSSSHELRIFLCHASEDKPSVRVLYDRLSVKNLRPWLDEFNLLPGQEWESEIPKAVRTSDVVVVCLSRASVVKTGYVQKEIRYALDVADKQPEGTIFVIPLKLEECEVPERLRRWHWVDYFSDKGHDRLMQALRYRAQNLSRSRLKESVKRPSGPARPLTWTPRESVNLRSQERAAPSAELILYVLERPGGRRRLFDLRLTSHDPELDLRERSFGTIELATDSAEFFRQHLKGDLTVEILRARGAFLAEQLLPTNLRKTLSALQQRIQMLRIISDDPWIPWEILRIEESPKSEVVDGPFLCEAFALTRWLPSIRQTSYLPLSRIAAVVPENSNLPYAKQEWKDLQALAGDGRHVERIPARLREIGEAFRLGVYDGWHFTGHGLFRGHAPALSRISLEEGEELTPIDLGGEAKRMGVKRPLVFLNVCDTGGWAPYFLRAGAGAFLGTLWPLRESQSLEFARIFYTSFVSGLPLAEAVQTARRAIRSKDDPTWLSYTAFAYPAAVCRPVPERQR